MNRVLLALAFSTALAAQSKVGVLHVQGQVYLIYGTGSNITMQAGDQAVVLVDSGPASMSADVMKAIRTVSQKPIAYIINTSYDRDHTGGDGNLAQGGFYMLATVHGSPQQAAIVSHLKTLDRMSADGSDVPHADWPTETYEDWPGTFTPTMSR